MHIFLTIDVESASCDYERDVLGSGYGLPYLLGSLRQACMNATFLVEAMDASRQPSTQLAETCHRILAAGQDLQLHVHPEMANLAGIMNNDGVLWRHCREEQARLIATGRDTLHKITGTMPVAFRAGSLTANTDTLLAMKDCGITLGSNRDLDTHSSIESRLNHVFPVVNDISTFMDVTDIPVSAFLSPLPKLDGRWRHLEPCALSLGEMTHALAAMHRAGYRSACLLTHPHEFYYRRGHRYYPNLINRRRWERLLRFLTSAPWAEVTTFSNLQSPVLPHPVKPIPNAPSPPPIRLPLLWTLYRLAEQIIKRAHGVER